MMNWRILWRQDWYVLNTFKRFANESYRFTDRVMFAQLIKAGSEAVKQDDIDKLRKIVFGLYDIRIPAHAEQDVNLQVNIL